MKRICMAAIAALIFGMTGESKADFGGPLPSPSPYSTSKYMHGHDTYQPEPELYGWNPILNAFKFWKRKHTGGASVGPKNRLVGPGDGMIGKNYDIPRGAYGPGGQFGPGGPGLGGPPGAALPGTPAHQMPGTLVFPFNPYVRSPRDFFMTEPGR